jgi:hypothetical protein
MERESSSETRVFRLKETKVVLGANGPEEIPLSPDHPGGELRVSEEEPFELEPLNWTVVREPEAGPDDFYERCIRPHAIEGGKSFICTGAAGTGKSRILLNLERDLKEKGETVKKITLTHVACRRLEDAETAHHFAIRHVLTGSFRGWVLVDEVGMLPAVLLSIIENLHVLGVKVAMFGDWNQLPPPMDNWRGTTIQPGAFRNSRLLHFWAGGTEFQLTRCRRSNTEHFELCLGVLQGPLAAAIEHARLEFPQDWGQPAHKQGDFHLVLSHRRRVALNHACQKDAVARYRADNPGAPILSIAAPEEDTGLLNTQQDFEIFAGTRLIGANNETKAVVNGGFLLVKSVSDEGCLVEDETGEEHELTTVQLTRSTRLAWAITITASQSREFGGRVAIWDTDSPHFSRAHLYTALTRVKIGEPGCSLVVM